MRYTLAHLLNPESLPLEAKPLFRPDVLRTLLGAFAMPDRVESAAPKLTHWAELLSTRRADSFKEQEILARLWPIDEASYILWLLGNGIPPLAKLTVGIDCGHPPLGRGALNFFKRIPAFDLQDHIA